MATVHINDNSPQAQSLLDYLSTLPFAEVVREQKMTFDEAVKECNGITANEFCDKLEARIKAHYRKNA